MNSKMNYDMEKYSEPVAKKTRISHFSSRDGTSYISSRSRDTDDYFSASITPNSLDESNSLGLNFTVLSNDSISKRIAMNNSSKCSSRGQSKSSNNSNVDRSQRNGNRTNGTIKTTTSSSYDTIRTDNGDINIDSLRETSSKNVSTKAKFSDYPPITSVEQRRKYKTEFDKDYSEYRQLHTIIEKTRNRFTNLQDELRKVHSSDERKYQEIQNQIIQEYRENNNDTRFQDKKQRFEYLHDKLSHIRKLVDDFDSQLVKGNVTTDNGLSYSSQQTTNSNTQSIHTAY
jgi:RNA polymerase II elongation factor ELL